MGTKQSRKRQRLYLPIAGLIVCMIAACAPIKTLFTEGECSHLRRVERFISQKDFEGAMRQSQETLARSPKSPPGDEALMSMGLLSAHYANPKRDYGKAIEYFRRLARDFPRSPLVEEAKIWIGVLRSFEKAKRVDLEIEEKKQELGR